jgi:hypothetical protein
MEVNMSRATCKIVESKIESGTDLSPNLFDGVEQTILSNLSDTYGRFIATIKYQRFKKSKNIQHELLDMKK